MKSNISQCKVLIIRILIKKVPLCLIFSDVDAYIIEENENKYLIFALAENNKDVLELYKKLWSKIKKQIKTINSGKSIKIIMIL